MKFSLYTLGLGLFAAQAHSYSYTDYANQLSKLLSANLAEIAKKDPSPVYYGAYRVHDSAVWNLVLDQGRIFNEDLHQSRWGEIELRMGTAKLDQSHPLPDDQSLSDEGFCAVPLLSIDSPHSNRLWRIGTEQAFRSAKERYQKVLRASETQRKDTSSLWDLAPAPRIQNTQSLAQPKIDTSGMGKVRDRLQKISLIYAQNPRLQISQLIFQHHRVNRLLVNTEHSQVLDQDSLSSLLLIMSIRHPDGSDLSLVDTRSFRNYPSESELDEVESELKQSVKLIDSIYQAPLLPPYAGPVLLEGRGAAVFLHEILGHRVESDRFRLSSDGQTFLSKLGEQIFPPFISISDNPLLSQFENQPLNGYYHFDDEGVKAQGTSLVEKGILKNFLANRSPALSQGTSTGNGRAVLGRKPMARMSNLVLKSEIQTPDSLLRQHLLSLAKEQGLPYALVIRDLSGGFTNTSRYMPQAFKLTPYYLLQVFVDGRPDRIVRGLDLAGTPLVSLGKIREVGTQTAVFNGFCGAESGWLPVSALSPSLLFDKLEFQKQELQPSLPPFLLAPRAP